MRILQQCDQDEKRKPPHQSTNKDCIQGKYSPIPRRYRHGSPDLFGAGARSFGAGAAVETVLRFPDRIRGVVLVDAALGLTAPADDTRAAFIAAVTRAIARVA
jgi:hypothetical protein